MASREELANQIKSSLNPEQESVFDQCINGNESVFCTGQGGTGKSWLLECIVRYFKEFPLPDNGMLAVTASTGIAAFLIKGITLHRFAGVGIEETDIDLMIQRASRGASNNYWINTHTLIIDEISMISATFFENLSLVATALRKRTEPFGGIRLIMFGDFLQLPPISKIDHSSIRVFHTDSWKELNIKTMELKQIVRQTDSKFIEILSKIRYGVCDNETEVYIQNLDRDLVYDDDVQPVRLFAKKNATEAYNASMLNSLDTPLHKFPSTDRGNAAALGQCPALHILELKEGCQVMVTRNISSTIVNGSIGIVVGFDTDRNFFIKRPRVELIMPDGTSSIVTMSRVLWETISPDGRVLASRMQFPLILAWAVTIHKSQGQTLPRVSVDMSGIFETGQAYVAMSRCNNPANLKVSNFDKSLVMAASSCVKFYHDLSADSIGSLLPAYENTSEGHAPPTYSRTGATAVANTTEQPWDSTIVQQAAQLPQLSSTQDTEIMLGNLSLRENLSSSQSDFES